MPALEYTRPQLYAKQERAIFTPKRWSLCEASTKSGKTVASIARIIEWSLIGNGLYPAEKGQHYWWVAPVSAQAEIAYERVKNNLTRGAFIPKDSPTPHIFMPTGTVIDFKSADKPDCFDSQTEILTDKGWRLFADLTRTERVLTLNPTTLCAEWQLPKRYIESEYSGEMFRIESGKLDLLVTPEHRFLVNARSSGVGRGMHKRGIYAPPKRDGGYYRFKRIQELDITGDRIPAKASWVGTDLDAASEDVCALLGIYLAEGCSAGSFGGVTALQNGDYTVHFTQSSGLKGGIKGDVRAQMRALFARLGLTSIKETDDGFFIRSKDLWSKFSKLGNCYTKFVPERIKELPAYKLRVLMHWMLLGDGTIRNRGEKHEVDEKVYYSTSRQLADDFQEIAIKAGFSAVLRKKNQPEVSLLADGREIRGTQTLWQVSVVNSQFNYFADSSETYVNKTSYNGMVYCVETENSTVLVRRNGKVCWSGNSLYGEDVYGAIIDEASRCRPDAWYAVRSTLTATRGPAVAIGNVKGRKNWFYEWCRKAEAKKDPNAEFNRITWRDAVEAGVLDPTEIEDARRNLPEFVFKELYEALASDDGGNPFGEDHIYACVAVNEDGSSRYTPFQSRPVAFGIDLAKKNDYLVVIGLDELGRVCVFARWNGVPWRDSIRRIHEIIGEDVPALVDSTGVGDPVLEELQVEHGNFRGYNFTAASKQRLMEGLAVSIQSHELTILDGPIKDELLHFEFDIKANGVRYAAAEGYSDDCVCSLALARQCWAETQPAANLMEFMANEADRARRLAAVREQVYEAEALGQSPSTLGEEFVRELTSIQREERDFNELTELYNSTIKRFDQGSRTCFRCNLPVIGSTRISDGVNIWHQGCYS